MFGWLKRLFSRKPAPANENLVEIKQEISQAAGPAAGMPAAAEQPERLAPHSTQEPNRPEKTCPKCGSPNDTFVHICWMCKAEI